MIAIVAVIALIFLIYISRYINNRRMDTREYRRERKQELLDRTLDLIRERDAREKNGESGQTDEKK